MLLNKKLEGIYKPSAMSPLQAIRHVPSFRSAIADAFEQGDQFPLRAGSADLIKTRPVAKMEFFGLDGEYVANAGGTGKGNRDIQGDGEDAVGVAGKGKCRIRSREDDPAMYALEAIEHVFGDLVV